MIAFPMAMPATLLGLAILATPLGGQSEEESLPSQERTVMVVTPEKVVKDRAAALLQAKSMGVFGLESILLGLGPKEVEKYDFESLPTITEDRELHVLILDNGRTERGKGVTPLGTPPLHVALLPGAFAHIVAARHTEYIIECVFFRHIAGTFTDHNDHLRFVVHLLGGVFGNDNPALVPQ